MSRSCLRAATTTGPSWSKAPSVLTRSSLTRRRPTLPSPRVPLVFSAPEEATDAPLEGNGTILESSVDEEAETIDLHPRGMTEENQHRIARYQATKFCNRAIVEGDRPLSQYMTLPVSQYSVLDAEKVQRLDENTFRVTTSTVTLLRIKATPVMTLTVRPHSTGCEVLMLDCTLEGSQIAKDVNDRFACNMRNYVSFFKNDETGQLELCADCVVQVAGIVPNWIHAVVPLKVFNRLGRGMLAKILDLAMPRFLIQLEKDYQAWAAGDDSRQAMSTGESFGLGKQLMAEAGDTN